MAHPAERLRHFSRFLKETPVDEVPAASKWDQYLDDFELTPDDVEQLETMVRGHTARALSPRCDEETFEEESRNAVLLAPRDKDLLLELIKSMDRFPDLKDFRATLGQRLKQLGAKLPVAGIPAKRFWAIAIGTGFFVVMGLLVALWFIVVEPLFPPSATVDTELFPPNVSRDLEFTIDTQGVPQTVQLSRSKLLAFPEAHVVEVSAWITFPQHKIKRWSGEIFVLGSGGRELAKRKVDLKTDQTPDVPPGAGIELFQQFDAQQWFQSAAKVFFRTDSIQADASVPVPRKTLEFDGEDSFSPGYNLKIFLNEQTWRQRFEKNVQTSHVQIANTGLKPFEDLTFAATWIDSAGQVLKSKKLKPISSFRTELPSGAELDFVIEAEFPTEVFTWTPGAEPKLVLKLVDWKGETP